MTRIKTETRTLANGAPGKSLYVLHSPKADMPLGAESQAECDGLIELMFDRDIIALTVQPEKFLVPSAEGNFSYTPDVRFVRREGCIGFQEFKGDYERLPEDEKKKYHVAGNYIRSLGFEYSLVDARKIREGHRLANIKLLHRYAACEFDASLLSWLTKRLDQTPGAYSIGTFRSEVGAEKIPGLFRLLWAQELFLDIDSRPITDGSVLWKVLS